MKSVRRAFGENAKFAEKEIALELTVEQRLAKWCRARIAMVADSAKRIP